MTDPACVPEQAIKKSKTKTKMGIKESAAYLASSPYIRNLAALVICYGMSINLVEVSWKGKLKQARCRGDRAEIARGSRPRLGATSALSLSRSNSPTRTTTPNSWAPSRAPPARARSA